jgi:hypothetical protein
MQNIIHPHSAAVNTPAKIYGMPNREMIILLKSAIKIAKLRNINFIMANLGFLCKINQYFPR